MTSHPSQPSSTLKLAVLPLLGFASAGALAYVALLTEFQQTFYASGSPSGCSVPVRKQLPTDITRGAVPQIDDALCILLPFFKQLVADRTSLAGGALIFSSLIPIFMRQCYQASSPNTRSFLLGPLGVLLVHLFGRVIGVGFALASFGTLFLALGSYQQLKKMTDTIPIVPTPAGSVYWSNTFLLVVSGLVITITNLDVSRPTWVLCSTALLAYPAWLTLTLLLATLGVASPKNEREARTALLDYSAEQVSYAFERKWSYYRKAALGSMAAYWFGMVRIGWAVYEGNLSVKGLPLFLFCDFFGVLVYIVLAIRIERLTVRSFAPEHPLTGEPRSRLSVDCHKAITLAPAGNPLLERGSWQPIVAGILCGPGMAAALWWSGAEEEEGWMARRAWREAAAVQGGKKQ